MGITKKFEIILTQLIIQLEENKQLIDLDLLKQLNSETLPELEK